KVIAVDRLPHGARETQARQRRIAASRYDKRISFHDLRHNKIIVFAKRRVGDDFIWLFAVGNDVLAHLQRDRHDTGHWLDALRIDLPQLLDPIEDPAEFGFEAL